MERFWAVFTKSVYSGVILSIAGIVNLAAESRLTGAFLFAVGLTSVFVIGAYLFTGAVGNTAAEHKPGWLRFLGIVLFGNLVGTLVSGLICPAMSTAGPIVEAAAVSWETKCAQSALSAFVSSCFCGFLMYTAWNANMKMKDQPVIATFVIVLCVMVFVLARFDHSIANAFLLSVSGAWDVQSIGWLCIMILGNSAGAILPAFVFRAKPTCGDVRR